MTEHRLTWNGSLEAQRQADDAYARLKPKKPKVKPSKPKPKKRRRKPFEPVNYFTYMTSAAWKRKRQFALDYHGIKCSVCGTSENLQVHHKHYRRLGREKMKDLKVLCEGCHANEHEGLHGIVMDPMTREYVELMRDI